MATKSSGVKSSTKKSPAKSSSAKAAGTKSPARPKKAAVKTAKSAGRTAEDKYTDPELREHIKEEVMAGDKGGNAGQWSARKAQMVAHEYEAEGGGYKGGRDETQKSLKDWGDEHWTTRDGAPAKQADGMHRYLPEKAWDDLSPAEKSATDRKKLKGSKQGEQFVANTAPAKAARKRSVKT